MDPHELEALRVRADERSPELQERRFDPFLRSLASLIEELQNLADEARVASGSAEGQAPGLFYQRLRRILGFQALTPEIRALALAQHTEEEIVAGLREARQTGGPELGDVIHELELELSQREPTA